LAFDTDCWANADNSYVIDRLAAHANPPRRARSTIDTYSVNTQTVSFQAGILVIPHHRQAPLASLQIVGDAAKALLDVASPSTIDIADIAQSPIFFMRGILSCRIESKWLCVSV